MKKIKLVIDRIEGETAILKNGTESISFPLNQLPADLKEGEILNISIYRDGAETEAQKQTAKEILNEILNNGV